MAACTMTWLSVTALPCGNRPDHWLRGQQGGAGERLIKDLKRKAYSLSRGNRQSSGEAPAPREEGLIERESEDHRFGCRRISIFRRLHSELVLLLVALGAQHRLHPDNFYNQKK